MLQDSFTWVGIRVGGRVENSSCMKLQNEITFFTTDNFSTISALRVRVLVTWKSFLVVISLEKWTRNAAHTYKWNVAKPSSSD